MRARQQDESGAAFTSDHAPGVALPLLPTLLVAVAVAAFSLICQEPSAPAATPVPTLIQAAASLAEPASVMALDLALAAPASSEPAFVPASVAFSRQFPMIVEARLEAPRRRAAPRVASSAAPSLRRAAPSPAQAAPSAPVVTEAAVAPPWEDSEDSAAPGLALPFAPAIQAVTRGASAFVGAQGAAATAEVSALGDAVVDLVGRLR